ncbi:MAG TPA: DUF2934 domain-containing protein [Thermoanaerobaculia bacterium]|nr:DUF2934 domain-containing protein [Thermoanaerobaculia bacterium]
MAAKPPRMAQATVKPAQQPAQATAPSLEERIRIRAYELYEERKGEAGDPDGDWYRAEQEVRGKISRISE